MARALQIIILLQALLIFTANIRADSLRIGYIGALSGDAAAIGSEIARTLQLSVNNWNANASADLPKLELIIEDDGYQVTKAISAYEKLKQQVNSRVIFMTTYGAMFALGKRPEQDQIVIVDTLDCNDSLAKISNMHTCVATRTESIADVFLNSARKNAGGALGILYEEEAWFNFIVAALRKNYRDGVIEVTAPVQATDYRTELLKLKSKDVKHLVFLGNDSMGRAMAQARAIGIKAQFYSIAGVMSPGFQALAGPSLEGTIVSNWLIPKSDLAQNFAKQYLAEFKKPVQLEFVAGPSLDAAKLVFEVLHTQFLKSKIISAQEIRHALSAQPPFLGVSGMIKMDADGAVRSIRETEYRYLDGKLVQP